MSCELPQHCAQCGRDLVIGDLVLTQQCFCGACLTWHPILHIHAGICSDDYMRNMPRYYTLNRLAGARSLN